jgi:hypothetical protein
MDGTEIPKYKPASDDHKVLAFVDGVKAEDVNQQKQSTCLMLSSVSLSAGFDADCDRINVTVNVSNKRRDTKVLSARSNWFFLSMSTKTMTSNLEWSQNLFGEFCKF